MEFLGQVVGWFVDPANWSGRDSIPVRLGEHLVLSAVPLALAVTVALPIGLYIGHTGRGSSIAINLSNVGRAIPTLAILVILFMLLTRPLVQAGFRSEAPEVAAILAMVFLALPPIVTNTYVGLRDVERDLVESARGMGMTELQILLRTELPIALPVVLAGIRTAAVQVVATATLGAVVATGGFGRYLIDGIAQRLEHEVFAGALLVALLAIATELVFAWLQRRAVSPGLAAAPAQAPREPAQAARSGGW
jgi:osmoprotectant transport system permease protein